MGSLGCPASYCNKSNGRSGSKGSDHSSSDSVRKYGGCDGAKAANEP